MRVNMLVRFDPERCLVDAVAALTVLSAEDDILVRVESLCSSAVLHLFENYDAAHVSRFCLDALDHYPPEKAGSRIRALAAVLPDSFPSVSLVAVAARTEYAVNVVWRLGEYGVDINDELLLPDLAQARGILKICLAFPDHWLRLDPYSPHRDDDLIEFIGSHAEHADAITTLCAADPSRLDAKFLEGYLDSTAPPLRDGFL